MSKVILYSSTIAVVLALVDCASAPDPVAGMEEVKLSASASPPQAAPSSYPAEQVEHGQYMVGLLGCGNCHTDGALIGEPNSARLLAGSEVGIAWSNPLEVKNPGVVFPANLTPDRQTGIGAWSVEDIVTMLQSGIDNHGSRSLPVMPWQTYARLTSEDAHAIAVYLKSLPPVTHKVPANVRPGHRTKSAFVHFGIYRSQQ
jgi:hypothetical protein